MSVAVVIVNYRTAGLVVDCLASVAAEGSGTLVRTIVVDNASPDDSVERIGGAIAANGWGGWAEVIAAERNGGFAWGNNIGIRRAMEGPNPPRFIHLLNPDTVVRAGAIGALAEFLEAHPGVGIAGSRLEDPDGTAQRSAFRWPTPAGEFEAAAHFRPVSAVLRGWVVAPEVRDEAHRTDWVGGASLMVRREVIERVGPLDDGYFMYYEEVELCRRAARDGWACWYVPTSRVVHLVGQASGVVQGQPKRRPGYWFDSRRRYFVTQFGRGGAIAADLAWIVATPLHHAWRVARGRPPTHPERFVRDLIERGAISRGLGP